MDRRMFITSGTLAAGAMGAVAVAGCGRSQGARAGAAVPATDPPTESAVHAATPDRPARAGKHRVLEAPPADVHAAIATKGEPAERVKAAVDAFGGIEAIINPGDRVVIKPNLAWGRTPDVGANTTPAILAAVIKLVMDAGARKVTVVEHSCDKSTITFEMSGAQRVCDELGVALIGLDNPAMYVECEVGGANISRDLLAREILESDVYINLPCLKHHGATIVSLSLKNQMGANWDRQSYHSKGAGAGGSENLHRNIADLAGVLRPTLVVIDATVALKSNGPKGPGDLEETGAVIVSHDMVAADALGTEMLGFKPADVPHLAMAQELGVGRMDIESLPIVRV
ncbi:MAG: DUF362 domain-containing protein [Armatimonadetes bacterium]|nr:DUF362 domain-containing protein [Armatimonadota bacterium]